MLEISPKPSHLTGLFVLLFWVIFMIILATTAMYSGLIAAFVSGAVSLLGYIITAFIQSRNGKKTIEVQREIAQMQKDEKLFYESQLKWTDKVREMIAKFVDNCFKFNILSNKINSLEEKAKKDNLDLADIGDISTKRCNYVAEATKLITSLNEEVTIIRLYLFHKDDKYEQKVLKTILSLEHNMSIENGIDSKQLDKFIELVRGYFDNQMKELKEKSA